jgi:hypothetical protein
VGVASEAALLLTEVGLVPDLIQLMLERQMEAEEGDPHRLDFEDVLQMIGLLTGERDSLGTYLTSYCVDDQQVAILNLLHRFAAKFASFSAWEMCTGTGTPPHIDLPSWRRERVGALSEVMFADSNFDGFDATRAAERMLELVKNDQDWALAVCESPLGLQRIVDRCRRSADEELQIHAGRLQNVSPAVWGPNIVGDPRPLAQYLVPGDRALYYDENRGVYPNAPVYRQILAAVVQSYGHWVLNRTAPVD